MNLLNKGHVIALERSIRTSRQTVSFWVHFGSISIQFNIGLTLFRNIAKLDVTLSVYVIVFIFHLVA